MRIPLVCISKVVQAAGMVGNRTTRGGHVAARLRPAEQCAHLARRVPIAATASGCVPVQAAFCVFLSLCWPVSEARTLCLLSLLRYSQVLRLPHSRQYVPAL